MIREKNVKSVLNKHRRRDTWFLDDYSVNPYEGCSFNCAYCYIRGSKYGENLSEKLTIKSNAFEILDKQLHNRAKKGQYGIIALASATDPYMLIELQYERTKGFLETILKHRFPVLILTKSDLVTRDIPLLKEIDKHAILPSELKTTLGRGVIIAFSMSSADERIAAIFEPGAPAPIKRFEALQIIKKEGILTGVNLIPVLPFITDTDEQLEKTVSLTKSYGGEFVLAGGLTLFGNSSADSKTLYFKLVQKHFPELMERYQKMFGTSSYPAWMYQKQLEQRVGILLKKYSIRNSIIRKAEV
ncbi:radical SAM protein [bacterium]|nr:radical SAM protein [bacterium]